MGVSALEQKGLPGIAETSGADLSPCGRYRYRLWRIWDHGRELCCWIMLNPSTADADEDDPTIRKCRGFAIRWGFGGMVVVNLFGFRATKPAALKCVGDPVGSDNDDFLFREARVIPSSNPWPDVIAAWGTKGGSRAQEVLGRLGELGVRLHALRLTKDGHPEHPLYVPYSVTPVRLEAP